MNFMTNIDLESNDPNTTIFGNCGGIDFGSCASGSTSNNNQIVSYVPVGQDSRASESPSPPAARAVQSLPVSRYENQKRRDWNTFCQYLRSHIPPVHLNLCNGGHVLEFLRYLDQFGKTKVHNCVCAYFGVPNPPAPCPCPLRQAWGSLDALIGRLRAAYEEHGGQPESNPFGARDVRLYLREVREYQAKARGISYEKKRKRPPPKQIKTLKMNE